MGQPLHNKNNPNNPNNHLPQTASLQILSQKTKNLRKKVQKKIKRKNLKEKFDVDSNSRNRNHTPLFSFTHTHTTFLASPKKLKKFQYLIREMTHHLLHLRESPSRPR